MAITTDIEWADSTLNLEMGCDGCELWLPSKGVFRCYAGALTERYAGKNKGFPDAFDKPALFLSRLDDSLRWPDLTGTDRPDKPWLDGLPRIIFLDDMGDTFTESLPIDWLLQPYGPLVCPQGHRPPRVQRLTDGSAIVCTRCHTEWTPRSPLAIMAETPHKWLMLTKRPSRMAELSRLAGGLPRNVWPGTTVTGPGNLKRVEYLLQVEGGGPRFLSIEPLLDAVDLAVKMPWQFHADRCRFFDSVSELECGGVTYRSRRIDWIVYGGESDQRGQPARPCDLTHVRNGISQCREAGVPVFVKQLGSRISTGYVEGHALGWWLIGDGSGDWKPRDGKGGDWQNWPDDLKVREMPRIEGAA
jgi:protein gp37